MAACKLLHLVSNQFASLASLEEEEDDQLDMDSCTDSIDFMTPSGKRMVRERPVKPTAKESYKCKQHHVAEVIEAEVIEEEVTEVYTCTIHQSKSQSLKLQWLFKDDVMIISTF